MQDRPGINAPPPAPAAQPPHAGPPAGPAPGGGKGFPWGKVLAGCGCATVLVCGGASAGMYFLYSKSSEAIADLDEGILTEPGTGTADEPAESQDDEANVRDRLKRQKRRSLDPQNVRRYIRQPLTREDVRNHLQFVRSWKRTPAYKNWKAQWKEMQRVSNEDDDSTAGKLRAARQMSKTMDAVRRVLRAYEEHVRQSGGYQRHFARVVRIGGAVAAAEEMAKSEKLDDPDSDRVAARILQKRPEIAREYQKNLEQARKAAERAKTRAGKGGTSGSYGALLTMAQGPGTVALAVMPGKSFETWKSLSASRREELRDTIGQSIAPGPWFGLMEVNPAALLTTAYLAEIEKFSPR